MPTIVKTAGMKTAPNPGPARIAIARNDWKNTCNSKGNLSCKHCEIKNSKYLKWFRGICRQPCSESWQWFGQEFLNLGNVQRCVQRAWQTGKIFRQPGFNLPFQFR